MKLIKKGPRDVVIEMTVLELQVMVHRLAGYQALLFSAKPENWQDAEGSVEYMRDGFARILGPVSQPELFEV